MPFDSIPDEPSRFTRILRYTRGLLSKEGGWIQGDYYDEGSFCLVGALNEARNRVVFGSDFYQDDLYDSEINELARLMGFQGAGNVQPAEEIPSWNDEPDRTQEEVVALIDKTLAKLDAPVR